MKKVSVGDPAPLFVAHSSNNDNFYFDTIGGRIIVLCFYNSAANEVSRQVLDGFCRQYRSLFDDHHICFFGVSHDPLDLSEGRVKQQIPGIRWFWDFNHQISSLYHTNDQEMPITYVIDRSLRLIGTFSSNPETQAERVVNFLRTLPTPAPITRAKMQAPVLMIDHIFEPEFCHKLIEIYQENGGKDSGFMSEKEGKTVAINDHSFKVRRDYHITDSNLRSHLQKRIIRRLVPEINKAFQFKVTRMERYIVACYDAVTGGYFRAHRDNTTKGTAHRRFAVTINLNSNEYEGGDLRFPEFGTQTYRASTGGAVVFSCSLLHEVLPITQGQRFCFLPFLYDDKSAEIRRENNAFLAQEVNPYLG